MHNLDKQKTTSSCKTLPAILRQTMQRQTLTAYSLQTIDWFDNKIVDWASAGKQIALDGQTNDLLKYHFGFGDASITSNDGQYVFIYLKLGTKGLLLKNGEILREINRSYYCADVYEYPAAFVTINSKTYLVHCPTKYCRLDFEDVETGEIVTNSAERDPQDTFHSRLEVSLDNKHLISKGWFWHPFDIVLLFDIQACLSNPALLDSGNSIPNVSTEICSASFIDNDRILLSSSKEESMNDEVEQPIPPGHLAVWNIKTTKISKAVKVNEDFGNIFAIDDKYCWDLFKYPKIIDFTTGVVFEKAEEINSGQQNSSIIHHHNDLPKISFNRQTKQLAIFKDDKLEILTK